jgi:hypothetical protein
MSAVVTPSDRKAPQHGLSALLASGIIHVTVRLLARVLSQICLCSVY